MSGFLSCPACGTSNIALGATACPGCRVEFAALVVNPQYQPAASAAVAVAPPPNVQMAPSHAAVADTTLVGVEYASIWVRMLAAMIDWAIFALPVIALYGWSDYWDAPIVPQAPLDWFATLAWFVYVAAMQSSSWQATLGMRALDLHIQRQDDFSTISPWRAIGRDLLTYLSAFLLMVGYLMIACTAKRQALHDKLAGTVVVRTLK